MFSKMSNIHTISDKKKKRKRSPERRVLMTIKNGVSMVQRDSEGNAIYRNVQEPKTKKRRTEVKSSGGDRRDEQAAGRSQLYPIAQLTDIESTGDGAWRVEWKNSSNELVTEALFPLDPWILVGHHDSQESAVVIHGVEVSAKADGTSACAMIPKASCPLSIGKLKRALVCVGPQKSSPENIGELSELLPKSSRSLFVSLSTYERLSKDC